MKKSTFLLIALFPLLPFAQERRLGVDIMTPLRTPALVFSYEQIAAVAPNHYIGFRAGIGTAQYFFSNQFTLQGVYYWGKQHQLELAPGFIYETNFRTWRAEDGLDMTLSPLNHHKGALFLRIGYVYNTSGKWAFRAGVNPALQFFEGGRTFFVPPFAPYAGVSYRF